MGTGRLRRVARGIAVVGACALVGASPGVARADAQYDGEATALRIEGLQLQLFPNGTKNLPPELRTAIEQLQAQAPEELQRNDVTLAMPDQVIGHAEYEGTDTQGAIPPNPLITADFLEAKSVPTKNGGMLSEASVAGLSIGGGALTADVIRTQCRGDGGGILLNVSQLAFKSEIVRGRVSLGSDTAVPIEGLGKITFNQRDTDGTTYGEATNVVIDLDSNLSLEALARLFDTTAPAVEDALKQVLVDLGETKFGPDGQQPLKEVFNEESVGQLQGGQVYKGLDDAMNQIETEAPEPLKDALNNLAHLDGTITISNAACAQRTLADQAAPSQPQQAVPAEPAAQSQPPLADTGAPVGVVGIGLAGLAALAGGGYVLLRLRRRGA
jgi:hypothetical protein